MFEAIREGIRMFTGEEATEEVPYGKKVNLGDYVLTQFGDSWLPMSRVMAIEFDPADPDYSDYSAVVTVGPPEATTEYFLGEDDAAALIKYLGERVLSQG